MENARRENFTCTDPSASTFTCDDDDDDDDDNDDNDDDDDNDEKGGARQVVGGWRWSILRLPSPNIGARQLNIGARELIR